MRLTVPDRIAVPLAALLVAAMAVPAAAPAAEAQKVPPEAYAEVNAALVENHVMPRYERLVEATAGLDAAADGYCAKPGAKTGEALKQGYDAAMDAWMGIQHIHFGPIELFMRGYRLYFWPEARGKVDDAVRDLLKSGNEAALRGESFGSSNVAAQGLPAVEYLLFGEPGLAGEGTPPAFTCTLLKAIAANLEKIAADLVKDWRTGEYAYVKSIGNPGPENTYYADHREATLAFFRALHNGLQLIGDAKLKPVTGETVEAAKPRVAESRLSGRGARNIVVNLEALEALYLGEGGKGLTDLVKQHGEDEKLDPLMRKAFRMTIETARSIDKPLGEAATDPDSRPKVEKLQTQIFALKQIVKSRLAAALELAVGFNALDGD